MENQEVDLAKALEFAEAKVALAEAVQRLEQNKDFIAIIRDGFIKDFALTQVANCGTYDDTQTRGFVMGMKARGILDDYLYAMYQEGIMAKDSLSDIRAEMEEE